MKCDLFLFALLIGAGLIEYVTSMSFATTQQVNMEFSFCCLKSD